GEYAPLVQKFGGQRINLSRNSKTMINPLDLMGHDYSEKRLALMDLMPIMLGDLSEPQKACLDVALTRAYHSRGITAEIRESWGKEPPILSEVVEALAKMEKRATSLEKTSIRSLINRLNMYVEGVFSFLNKSTNIDFSNDFVCFDIGRLPKQVKPAMMFLVLEYIYKKMRSSLERKLLVIDEAWSLLSRSQEAYYILEIVKTCRKFNLGLFLINQEVENMLDSQAGRSVLANTSYTLLLRQKPSMIRSVKNVFHLSDSEKVMLLTARPGEGLLIMEDDHSEIKIIASKSEHKIITTNPDEILKQREESEPQKRIKNNIDPKQRAYIKNKLNEVDIRTLKFKGFKEVKQKDLTEKTQTYLVANDKYESPTHIINIKEITDYIKKFTKEIRTYRTVKPDIVFNARGKTYAIEVETGKINNLKRSREKVSNLEKYYKDRWYFFVTNRNLLNYYSKLGKVMTKRTVKTKINRIFKSSKK
ncbi:hypothetical protein COU61_04995, partial [Candidatus Pacearchaeota archaeon CG10_big_fil_rev_8_21_14_0_10_35_13]